MECGIKRVELSKGVESYELGSSAVPREFREIEEVVGGACPVTVIAVEGTMNAREPLAAAILRTAEEFGSRVFIVVSSVEASSVVYELLCKLNELIEMLGFRVVHVTVDGNAAVATRRLRKLIERLCVVCPSGIISCISPAPRYLASALTAASLRGRCEAAVVHVNFWFGPWRGLTYPIVPRSHEPLEVLYDAGLRARYSHVLQGVDEKRVLEVFGKYLGGLSRLHECIAALTLRLNKRIRSGVTYPGEQREGDDHPIILEVCGHRVTIPDWRRPQDWINAVKQLESITCKCQCGWDVLHAVFELSGACIWRPVESCTAGRGERRAGRLLLDTNLLYKGFDVEVISGVNAALPYALVEEILRRVAEAKKRANALGAKGSEVRVVKDLLVQLILENLERHGTPIVPSPPPPVDTAVPRMDPLLLQSYEPATEDTGAYRLWCESPLARYGLLRPHLMKCEFKWEVDERNARVKAARASYAILRFLCLLELLTREAGETELIKILKSIAECANVRLYVGDEKVWEWSVTSTSGAARRPQRRGLGSQAYPGCRGS